MLQVLENDAVTRVLIPVSTQQLLAIFMESETLRSLAEGHHLGSTLRTAESVGIMIRLKA